MRYVGAVIDGRPCSEDVQSEIICTLDVKISADVGVAQYASTSISRPSNLLVMALGVPILGSRNPFLKVNAGTDFAMVQERC